MKSLVVPRPQSPLRAKPAAKVAGATAPPAETVGLAIGNVKAITRVKFEPVQTWLDSLKDALEEFGNSEGTEAQLNKTEEIMTDIYEAVLAGAADCTPCFAVRDKMHNDKGLKKFIKKWKPRE